MSELSIGERLARIERMLKEQMPARLTTLDVNRAYSDAEVCVLLGGISPTSLWRIRKSGLLDAPAELLPGGVARITGRQIAKYIEGRDIENDPLNYTSTGRKRKLT